MLCRNPFTRGMQAFPCGRCMPCLFNRRRLWTHRMMLEALCHADSCFLTLTYQDENLPLSTNGRSSLAPEDLRNFLKRIRSALVASPEIRFGGQKKIRFYAVGEYGEVGERPHYHMALYGVRCARGETLRRLPSTRPLPLECCAVCNLVARRGTRRR